MTKTPDAVGEEQRRDAAFALEELSKRQQRAAVSNLQRSIYLRTDDPASHQRALASLRQSIGHRVPGWQEMLLAVSLLTGESLEDLEQKAESGGKVRPFIDGIAMTSDELAMLRLWRKSRSSRREEALAVMEMGQTAEGGAADEEEGRREGEAEERMRTAMMVRTMREPFRVIAGGQSIEG